MWTEILYNKLGDIFNDLPMKYYILDFFEHYITPGRPFLLKSGAKNQAAFKKWTDEYMKSFPGAEKELVQVEPNLKEIRESPGFEIPLKEFIERYKKESVYMVNKVPSFLM